MSNAHDFITSKAIRNSVARQVQEIDKDLGYFICDTCKQSIGYSNDYQEHKYCLNCGQKLDWSRV